MMNYKYLVIIVKDGGTPEIFPFENLDDAEIFFEKASLQWSESHICEILKGPRS